MSETGKSFSRRNLIVMSLGNIIGSGIFLGSSTVLSVAGPSAVFAYLLGGGMMALEVTFIAEMCVIRPAPGAFRVHASEIFGPWIGFVNGWMFWFSGVLGMAGEVAAAAMFTRFWFPRVPLWVFCAVYALGMAAVNLCDLRGLSRAEGILASVKVLALLFFIAVGALTVLGVLRGGPAVQHPFASLRALFPHGAGGFCASMLMVMFSYTGTGIIGLAIADTRDPAHTAPSAIRVISLSVLALYGLSVLFLVLLAPAGGSVGQLSPYVALLNRIRIPYSDSVLNFICLTASLSGLNSSMYSSSRMLSSLGGDGQAPRVVLKTAPNGVPIFALAVSAAALLLTAVLSYLMPQQVFVLLASASGFLAMFNWLTISVTHFFYRRKTLREHPEKLRYRAPGYPVTSFLLAGLILAVFATAPLYPGQVSGLTAGLVFVCGLVFAYFLLRRMGFLK